jgi:mono/diheme cytochrome c family protein
MRGRPQHLLALALIAGCPRPASNRAAANAASDASEPLVGGDPRAAIEFRVEGRPVRSLSLRALREAIAPEVFTNCDGYYLRDKRFRALPIERVLALGFQGENLGPLDARPFVLRAIDGYTVPLQGTRLLEGGAYLAFADDEHPDRWEPIGPRRSDPAPFYLVWKQRSQCNLETHPRPWQLAVIEVARFEAAFPHTVPTGEAESSPAYRGFSTFARECVRCHAINREGGRVGPELNVPRSIVEYRPIEQIRAYIRNPLSFRYGAMPPHPHLTEQDLDDLVAYFTAMRDRKFDPDAPASTDAGYSRDP